MKNNKSRYDLQLMPSTACKLSHRRTALNRCTNIEILQYRNYYYYCYYKSTSVLNQEMH